MTAHRPLASLAAEARAAADTAGRLAARAAARSLHPSTTDALYSEHEARRWLLLSVDLETAAALLAGSVVTLGQLPLEQALDGAAAGL